MIGLIKTSCFEKLLISNRALFSAAKKDMEEILWTVSKIISKMYWCISRLYFLITVVYPYLHLSYKNTLKEQTTISKSKTSDSWMEQGIFSEVDAISSSNSSFSIRDSEYVIFMGLRIDNDSLPSRIGIFNPIINIRWHHYIYAVLQIQKVPGAIGAKLAFCLENWANSMSESWTLLLTGMSMLDLQVQTTPCLIIAFLSISNSCQPRMR